MQQINFGELRYCLLIIASYNNDEITVNPNVIDLIDIKDGICKEFSIYLWEEKNDLFKRVLKQKYPTIDLKREIRDALTKKYGDKSIDVLYPQIIWYPGSAYASEAWVKYLHDTFKGF